MKNPIILKTLLIDTKYIKEMELFIHSAFCVDGTTKFDRLFFENGMNSARFKCLDKKRNTFFVTISKLEK